MAKESLREHLNRKIKEKGSTLSKEKAKAKKYKSIAAAKKAGALYYTNKAGKVMAAVYATDLALKSSLKPKLRPTKKKPTPQTAPKTKPSVPVQPSGGGDKPTTVKVPEKSKFIKGRNDPSLRKPYSERGLSKGGMMRVKKRK